MPFLDFGAMYEPVRQYTAGDISWALREAVEHIEGRILYILPARNEAAAQFQNVRQTPWWDLTPFEWVDKLCWGGRYNRLDPLLRYLQALLTECQTAQSGGAKLRGKAFRHLARYYNHLARERSVGLLLSLPDVMIWEDYNRAKALAKLCKTDDDGRDLNIVASQPLKFRVWDHPKPARWWNIAAWMRRYPGVTLYVCFVFAAWGLFGPPWRMLPLIIQGLLMAWAYREMAKNF